MFSNEKNTAISELNEKLTFYKEIGIENLYVFNTLKNENNKNWNFLKAVIKIAHQKGLKIHPIITPGNRVRDPKILNKKQKWLIKDQFGKGVAYLNLSDPDVRKYIQKKVKKLLKYEIDGIHLDYIRFPYLSPKTPGDSVMSMAIRVVSVALNYFIPDHIYFNTADNYFSYDERTLQKFNEYYMDKFISKTFGNRQEARGKRQSKPEIQNQAEGGMLKAEGLYPPAIGSASHVLKEWITWNASNVTKLVQGVKKLIKESGKRIPLSAAVMSNPDFALYSLGQDWGRWGKEGLVDVLCPMIYSNDNKWFKERMEGVLATVKGRCKVYAGIAIVSSANKNTPEGVASQIKTAKEMGADGIVIFSGYSLTEEYGEVLKAIGDGR